MVSLRPRWLVIDAPAANLRSEDDYVLTKELQRQLRRLGCYSGEMNGTWTPSTLRAMQTFMNRVNAVLPLGRPDRILLALLQRHPDKTCSKPCLSGENPSPDGRCVPSDHEPSAQDRRPDAAQSAVAHHRLERSRDHVLGGQHPAARACQAVGSPGDRDRQAGAAPKSVALPPKPALPRSMVATANREPPRSSQRSERESSRPTTPNSPAHCFSALITRCDKTGCDLRQRSAQRLPKEWPDFRLCS